jgi:DnaJ domain
VRDRFFCFACGRDHRSGTAIGRDHKRYSAEGGHESGGIFSDLREFYLQTKGIEAAFRILGLGTVRIQPPRFGRGWPSEAAIEKAYRKQAQRFHPDRGGDPHEFRKVQWAIEILRRYRPQDR